MASVHPQVTNRTIGANVEPLAVSPRQACILLGIGNTRLYQLIGNRELESYLEGRARRITLASIRGRVANLSAGARAPHGRGRPRKPLSRMRSEKLAE
jgi:excisionase family DNA binding protein